MIKSSLRAVIGARNYQNLVSASAFLRHRFNRITTSSLLVEIGRYRGTDKVDSNHSLDGRSYLHILETYVQSMRFNAVNVLEVGVKGGASLRTWADYFPNARICGLDIDPDCARHSGPRISIEIGSQGDKSVLANSFGSCKFDLIIDDGSHVNQLTLASYEGLIHRLNPGGFYVIEDLGCSYEKLDSQFDVRSTWPGMKYNDPEINLDNRREDLNLFFEDKIRELDFQLGELEFCHFWSRMCVMRKRRKTT